MIDYFINSPNNRLPTCLTQQILSESDALQYHVSLRNYSKTPLISLSHLAKKHQVANIFVKDESQRFGLKAFKGLGASFAIHKILQEKPEVKTFCTATDGNHGRAVAWAAAMAGKQAVVFVPRDTSLNRIDLIREFGAMVIQLEKNYDETCAHALQSSLENDWELVQDTAWEGYETIPALIMAGYLTHFKELEADLHPFTHPKIDLVFLQAGAGGWAGSAVWYYLNRYQENRPKLVIVEPHESDGILASFVAGKRTLPTGNQNTIMGGLNCGIPSLTGWEIIKVGADAAMKVEDKFSEMAVKTLYYSEGDDPSITAGESGAGGLAGFLALKEPRFAELVEKLDIRP